MNSLRLLGLTGFSVFAVACSCNVTVPDFDAGTGGGDGGGAGSVGGGSGQTGGAGQSGGGSASTGGGTAASGGGSDAMGGGSASTGGGSSSNGGGTSAMGGGSASMGGGSSSTGGGSSSMGGGSSAMGGGSASNGGGTVGNGGGVAGLGGGVNGSGGGIVGFGGGVGGLGGGIFGNGGGTFGGGGGGGMACPPLQGTTLYVATSGSDSTGNGTQTCPYVTLTKAVSGLLLSGATTIQIQAGSGSVAAIFGAGCTAGGSNCDTTPIHIPITVTNGLTIKGSDSDPTHVVINGGNTALDTTVFQVSAPAVGFANMTIAPKRIATSQGSGNRTAGASAIRFNAGPSFLSSGEASVTNVVINGVPKTNNGESTGSNIVITGGTSPTIGPGVTIIGGDHSVVVAENAGISLGGGSAPTITSSAAAPSFFHSPQFACIRVEQPTAVGTLTPTATVTATTTADPGRLHLQDCGGNGGIVVDTTKKGTAVTVTNTLIDTSGVTALANYGIRLQHSGNLVAKGAVTITGLNEISPGVGAGIELTDTSTMSIAAAPGPSSAGVTVRANATNGVHVGGSSAIGIDSLHSNGNRNGLLCDANGQSINVTAANSDFTGNRTFGVNIAGKPSGNSCAADLGSGQAGNNIFNTTGHANGVLGLCWTSTIASTASGNTWGCGYPASMACAPATTTLGPLGVNACDTVGDYNTSPNISVPLPQTCCGP